MKGITSHVPGYTGYIPNSQHVVAMTFGQATNHLLQEQGADDDPTKWRKHVSYAEFTPPRTPIEKHHIPGYSGFVPGVVADSGQLFGKTYGKMTLKAIKGEYESNGESDRLTTVEKQMLADAAGSHPAESKDSLEGGSSWSGASPYRAPFDYEVGTIHPHQPQSWGLATGAEPWRESALIARMRRKGHKDPNDEKPSVRYYAKNDPCDPNDPEKKLFSSTPQPHHVPGYSGFMPGILSDSIFGETCAAADAAVSVLSLASRACCARWGCCRGSRTRCIMGLDWRVLRLLLPSMAAPRPPPSLTSLRLRPHRENALRRYARSTHTAFKLREEAESRPTTSRVTTEHIDPTDGVIPFRPRTSMSMRHSQFKTTARPDKPPKIAKHVPGYTGFIPGVVSESMYGKTFPQQSISAIEGDKARFHYTALEPDAQVRPRVLTPARRCARRGARTLCCLLRRVCVLLPSQQVDRHRPLCLPHLRLSPRLACRSPMPRST